MKRNKSFIKSLTRSYVLIFMIPFAVIMIFLLSANIHNTQENIKRENETAAELITSQLNALLENMSFLSIQITNNVMGNAKGLAYSGNSLIKEEEYYSRIQAECCSYAVVDSPYRVVFFSEDGYYITSDDYNMEYNSTYRLPEEELNKLIWLEEVRENSGKSLLLPLEEGAVPIQEGEFLTLARAIRDPGKVVGYLCVQSETEAVKEILKIGSSKDAEIMLWDALNQRSICSTEGFPDAAFEGAKQIIQELAPQYLGFCKTGINGIDVILLSDRQAIYNVSLKRIAWLCAEALVLVLLTLIFIKYYARKMTKPLKILTKQMNRLTLDKLSENTDIGDDLYEEIQYLYTGYEQMQKRLDMMIHKELASRTLQMQEKLNSLQAQINPHFLYNTLNVIGIMGCENQNQKIYDACLKLTTILRYSIADKNAEAAQLREEVDNIRAYFELMKLRFEDRIEYDIQCEKEAGELEIPRLCLQPFVENMFEHAYNSQHRRIYAFVNCKKRGDCIEVIIQDDGQGMERERLEIMKDNIKKREKELNSGRAVDAVYGIGIENTILRMSLFFGERFLYNLKNAENGGFCVEIRIGLGEDKSDGEKNTGSDC